MNIKMANELARVIVNCRDLCGNENEAARNWFADYEIQYDEQVHAKARSIANGIWRQSQRDAGVNPKYLVC